MAFPIRQFEPQTIYFLTSRTQQSRFLMVPSKKTNELLGGILARAVRQCEVELFAYVFTSNHYHLMVRAPSAIAMSSFMQQLQSNIAIKVGRLVDWRDHFFGRRYSAEPVVDEKAQIDRLRYILSHGVKEGLVSAVRKWPGLSCAQGLLDGEMRSPQRWRDWTRRWKMKAQTNIDIDRFSDACPSESETLTLTRLPAWQGDSDAECRQAVAKMVAEIDADAPNKRARPERILAQHPHDKPKKSDHSPRPKAHGSNTPVWLAAVLRYRAFVGEFRKAARLWLAGHFDVEFPEHCFRPPPWRVVSRIV